MVERVYRIVGIHDTLRLGNTQDEDAQKDIPQVEGQLVLHVRKHVPGPTVLVEVVDSLIHTDRAFFVDIGGANADGDRKDGDVHHHQQTQLYGRVDIRQVK